MMVFGARRNPGMEVSRSGSRKLGKRASVSGGGTWRWFFSFSMSREQFCSRSGARSGPATFSNSKPTQQKAR